MNEHMPGSARMEKCLTYSFGRVPDLFRLAEQKGVWVKTGGTSTSGHISVITPKHSTIETMSFGLR